MRLACSFKSGAVDRRLCQSLDDSSMCSSKLRVQGEEITGRLLYQGSDFGLLRVCGVNLDVEVLQDVVDVGGHIRRAFGAVNHHHAAVQAIRGHYSRRGAKAARQRSASQECEHSLPVEQRT